MVLEPANECPTTSTQQAPPATLGDRSAPGRRGRRRRSGSRARRPRCRACRRASALRGWQGRRLRSPARRVVQGVLNAHSKWPVPPPSPVHDHHDAINLAVQLAHPAVQLALTVLQPVSPAIQRRSNLSSSRWNVLISNFWNSLSVTAQPLDAP